MLMAHHKLTSTLSPQGAMLEAISINLAGAHAIGKLLLLSRPAALASLRSELGDVGAARVTRELVRLTAAYARRTANWEASVQARLAGKELRVDPLEIEAIRVTQCFEEEGRDQLLVQVTTLEPDPYALVHTRKRTRADRVDHRPTRHPCSPPVAPRLLLARQS